MSTDPPHLSQEPRNLRWIRYSEDMASSPVDRRKVYVRIADELRRDIAGGRFPIGEPFPSIGDLVDRFGAAKATVERAMDVLRGEGLLASRQGSRTVVVAAPDVQAATNEAEEHSQEFEVLFGQLQEIRNQVKRLGVKLQELDERTKDL
jgi:DNA-binding GntR family transcriptional regulator